MPNLSAAWLGQENRALFSNHNASESMEELQPMRNRAFRPVIQLTSLLLMTALSSQAGPVRFGDVVHVLTNVDSGGQRQELRVKPVSPGSRDIVSGSTVNSESTAS